MKTFLPIVIIIFVLCGNTLAQLSGTKTGRKTINKRHTVMINLLKFIRKLKFIPLFFFTITFFYLHEIYFIPSQEKYLLDNSEFCQNNINPENIAFSDNSAKNQMFDLTKGKQLRINNNFLHYDKNWYSVITENIKKEEYFINWIEQAKAYQAPNRAQNLRFTFYENGFSVRPRTTKIPTRLLAYRELPSEIDYITIDDWFLSFNFSICNENGNATPFSGKEFSINKNAALAEDDILQMTFLNDEKGMRQNFIVKNKPANHSEQFKISVAIAGDLKPLINNSGVIFVDKESSEKMRYNDLKSWDATGKEIASSFIKGEGNVFFIVADIKDAEFPVTIDPLSSTSIWNAESNQASANFGMSASLAGDVNSDGFADVIISAPNYDNGEIDEGKIYVYHGSTTGLSSSPNWVYESNQTSAQIGSSVGTAGDVNGDGYSDVFVGSAYYDYSGYTDNGIVWVFHGSATGMVSSPSWTMYTAQSYASFGYSVASAGDVNGDGCSDLIIGAPFYDQGGTNGGKAFVYLGSSSGLSANSSWSDYTTQTSAFYGWTVACAGDVNGDSYSDIMIAAPYYDYQGYTDCGRVWLYYGSGTGLSTSSNWNNYPQKSDVLYGFGLSPAGDVNADGFSDIIIGGHGYNTSGSSQGKVWAYYGSSTGLPTSSNWSDYTTATTANYGFSVALAGDVNGDGYSDILVGAPNFDAGANNDGKVFLYDGSATGISATPSWTNYGGQSDMNYGICVSTAGDVNGDGFSDVIVSAPYCDNGQTDEGKVYAYYGSGKGPSHTSNWYDYSTQVDAQYGFSVSTAGDVNSDGYADIIVGVPYYDQGQTDCGKAYVYKGSATGVSTSVHWSDYSTVADAWYGFSVATAGDVNRDGYHDIIVGAPGWSYYSGVEKGRAYLYKGSASGVINTAYALLDNADKNPTGRHFGYCVGTAGDINGDHYADLVVGVPHNASGYDDKGAVFIVWGGSDISNVYWNNTVLFPELMPAEAEEVFFGASVSTAGDIDGDGYDEIVVGAYKQDYPPNNTDNGAVYIYHNDPNFNESVTRTQIITIHRLNAEQYSYDGWSVSTAGDFDGDGYSDVVVGSPGYDYSFGFGSKGAVTILYGASDGQLDYRTHSEWHGSQYQSYFGASVGCAGDVNGDGFSDVVVGAYMYDEPGYSADGGKAFVFFGRDVENNDYWQDYSTQGQAHFGYSVCAAGDVNGDGYSDIIVGAPEFDKAGYGEDNNGMAFVYYGGMGNNFTKNPSSIVSGLRQSNPTTSATVNPGGLSGANGQIRIRQFVKNPFGKCSRGKINYEVARNGVGWSDGSVIKNSSSVADLPLTGTYFPTTISGINTGYEYRWRSRSYYETYTSQDYKNPPYPFLKKSTWKYYNAYLPLPVGGIKAQNTPLPVELIQFNAKIINKNSAELNWSTATEIDNYGFEIERASTFRQTQGNAGSATNENLNVKGKTWQTVGFVQGQGNSNSPHSYSFTDEKLNSGKYSYRLKIINTDGSFEYSSEVDAEIGLPNEYYLSQNYPNPFNPTTTIEYQLPFNSEVKIELFSITGERAVTLLNQQQEAGYYTIEVNTSKLRLASGVYVYRMVAANNSNAKTYINTRKLVVLK